MSTFCLMGCSYKAQSWVLWSHSKRRTSEPGLKVIRPQVYTSSLMNVTFVNTLHQQF